MSQLGRRRLREPVLVLDRLLSKWLAVELTQRIPGHPITVLNRGVGGEEIRDMLERFDTDVIATKPDLVLWQFGTNSVIRDNKFDNHSAAIREGLTKIRSTGADIVLIDPQFAPKVIVKPEATRMVELIASTAKHEDVDLFPRFDVMRRWHEVDHIAFKTFVSADGLHMNNWSYGCSPRVLARPSPKPHSGRLSQRRRCRIWCGERPRWRPLIFPRWVRKKILIRVNNG